MTELESALVEVASLLDEMGLPYMLIGGLAVALWGEPRATLDVDLSVWVDPAEFDETVRKIAARFPTVADPLDFVRRTRVLPVETSQSVRADIVFAALQAEREMMDRAQTLFVAGAGIRVASVEDLTWMKLISDRPRDAEDAKRLIRHFREKLDRGYLEPRLREIAEALGRPDILNTYRREMGL